MPPSKKLLSSKVTFEFDSVAENFKNFRKKPAEVYITDVKFFANTLFRVNSTAQHVIKRTHRYISQL